MQVEVDQLLQVCAYDLVRVYKDDLVKIHGEQDVEEENFVCPYDPLLFALLSQPRWPLVGDKFVPETVFLSEVRNKFLRKMVKQVPNKQWMIIARGRTGTGSSR